MENRNQYDELLMKYMVNELNSEEEEFIEKWIKEDEQNWQYFDELSKTWRLTALRHTIRKINVNEELEYVKQIAKGNLLRAVPGNIYQQPEEDNATEKRPARRVPIYKIIISIAVAASVLFMIFSEGNLLNNKKQDTQTIAFNENKLKDTLTALLRQEENLLNKPRKFVLKDGSLIILAEKSEISFYEPFIDNKREITLTGKADFVVAKDKAKPFTVISGDISTTALGTQFTVTAYREANNITVRLYEGKVVVRSSSGANKKLKNFYLLSGQELVYNKKNFITKVTSFEVNSHLVKQDNNKESISSNDDPSIPAQEKNLWYMFNNQSLPQIFGQLMEMYQVEIIYAKKDLRNIYFIGKFNKTDSVETILKQIGAVNNLKITREDRKFIISK